MTKLWAERNRNDWYILLGIALVAMVAGLPLMWIGAV